MPLYALPLLAALGGLVLYVVLAGADFGAALWQLGAGRGPAGTRLRDFAHHAMAPVWEANHVWLIFVLTVVWTAYPAAFGSIATTLSIPLFVALVGILIRGAAYALRAGTSAPRELRLIDAASSLASVISPFSLGTVIGALAARRVPVGNARGNLVTSWTNPLSILIGLLAVATCAYLAAVYLAADASRHEEGGLAARFRARALGSGVIAGALALAGLAIVHVDAPALAHRLGHGPALGAVVVSAAAGLLTLALVAARRCEPARYSAALAVASVIAGWAIAQQPTFLPGLTIRQAAAPHDALVAVTVAIIAGGLLLFPSLGLLFALTLGGRLGHAPASAAAAPAGARMRAVTRSGLWARTAAALLVSGVGFLTVADAGWAHAVGVVALVGFIVVGFIAVAPAQIAQLAPAEPPGGPPGPGAAPPAQRPRG